MKLLFLLSTLAAIVCTASAQKTEFSGEHAYEHLKVLAGEIGPRPMGSPAEQRAMEYAVSKFKEYGCEEAYIMPLTVAGGVNTKTGVAVGVRKGTTGRMIVIGGHIDSSGPDVPGANDDGSGVASVIELARVLCKRQNESTVVFCCWGGEEEGLRGSEYFVDAFPLIDSVSLMLQIDMADGAGLLEIDPDGSYQKSAPRWLTRAAFEIALTELGYSDVRYLTHFMTLNSAGRGASGSDHGPFLRKGIPAIDFTSDVSYPIHTPLDNLQTFNPAGLVRSGNIVLKLFERFDGGVPSRETEKYYLVQFGSLPIFFSHWMIWLFVLLAVAAGFVALVVLMKRRPRIDPTERIRWSGVKILFFVIVIQTFIWFSENVVGLIRGYRFPWVNNFDGFVVLAILAGLIGLWLVLQLATRWRITLDPFVLYLRALILLVVSAGLVALSGPELTIYPASAILFLALAMLFRHPVLKVLCALLAPYMIIRLVFVEDLSLFLRMFAEAPADSTVVLLIHTVLIVSFAVISLPFAYGFVAVARDACIGSRIVRHFRSPSGLGVVLLVSALLTVYLATRPVYDRLWNTDVRVEQRYSLGADSSVVQLGSGEYLDGLRVTVRSRDTVLHGRNTKFSPLLEQPSTVSWLSLVAQNRPAEDSSANDSLVAIHRELVLRSALRPYVVEVRYYGRGLTDVSSSWSIGPRRRSTDDSPNSRSLTWFSFPDTVLHIPLTIAFKRGTSVTETVTATYDTLAFPLRISREFTSGTYRTIVTSSDTIRSASFGTDKAEAAE